MPHVRQEVILGDNDAPVLLDPEEIRELLSRVAWPSHEPIQFLRRRGSVSPADEEHYRRFHTVENLETMRRLGIRMPKRFHLFKGFGLSYERPEIEKTIECARWLHEHGMKVSVYVGGTLFSDYFFKEVPEAVNWLRSDQFGQPVTYGGYQLWRYFACLNHPDYRAYVKKVLDVAVEEVEADEIFFDNQILRYEPRSCRCRYCVEHFRRMVAEMYTPEELERRYGFPEPPDVNPPVWSQACRPWRLDDLQKPDLQDWITHRCRTVAEFYREMADYVHAKRPETVVGMNIKGVHAHNRAFDHGIDHDLLGKVGLQFSCLDAGQAHSRMIGRARVSEIRTFKAAHSTGIHFTCGGWGDLPLAEYQVFTYRPFYAGYGWAGSMDMIGSFTPLAQFFRLHQDLFRGKKHIFEVGVIRTRSTMNFNCLGAHEVVYPVEETLLSAKLPMGIVFDGNMDRIAGYKVLVAAEQRALSDEWIEALLKFVENGGGVVFTGRTGEFDGWYRPRRGGRPAHGLEPFFGQVPQKKTKKKLGRGRVVYLPELKVPYRFDISDWPFYPLDKILPLRNPRTLLEAVEWAAGEPFTVQAKGPHSVVMEVIEGRKWKSLSLHFVNYDPEKKGRLEVRMWLSERVRKVKAELLRPAEPGAASLQPPPPQPLKVTVSGGFATFRLPVPRVYAAVLVEW